MRKFRFKWKDGGVSIGEGQGTTAESAASNALKRLMGFGGGVSIAMASGKLRGWEEITGT